MGDAARQAEQAGEKLGQLAQRLEQAAAQPSAEATADDLDVDIYWVDARVIDELRSVARHSPASGASGADDRPRGK